MAFSIPGLVYDLIFVLLVLAVALAGKRRGFLSSVLWLGGTVGGIIGGVWGTRAWAQRVYDEYLGSAVSRRLAEAAGQYGDEWSAALDAMPFLPQRVREILSGAVQGATDDLIPRLTAALEPLLLPLVQAAMFLVLLFAVRLAVRLVARALRGVNMLPVLGEFNKILGFAFGFVNGLLDCWLLMLALWICSSLAAQRAPFLAPDMLAQSRIYTFLANFNPFAV